MKKALLVLVAALFASAAVAQEQSGKYPSFAGFVTNGFWDNWEISVGGGALATFSSGKNAGSFGDRIGYTANLALTKWVHPVFGVRGMFEGGELTTVHRITAESQHIPYLFIHGDALINFSNWAGGYRADRVYYAIPYAGMGYMITNFTDDSKVTNHMGRRQAFTFDYGLINKFRVSKSVDIDIEFKGIFTRARVTPSFNRAAFMHSVGATLGITYRFNRRDWERKPVCPTISTDELNTYRQAAADANAALAAAKAENARLAGDLKAAQDAAAKAAADAAAAKNKPAACDPSTIILYRIGTSTLTAEEKVRLDLTAEAIKKGSRDQVYTIQGHADPQTGTTEINQRLSNQRAKVVYDYLVGQGVNPNQLRYEGMGDTNSPYNLPAANRVAIIK